jgi:YD repeat-containing protein
MLNNPVKYKDPSGHKACVDYDDEGNCVEEEEDPVRLTENGEFCAIGGGCYDGRDMIRLFERYADAFDWKLSPLGFLALILEKEMAYLLR